MSLDHAILGFLSYSPLSGYDLKSMFDLSVQHFWPADQSQIYRTLGRLEERGFTTVEVVKQEDRPDRKVYHITPRGRDELHRWLLDPTFRGQARIARLVQIFFAGKLSDAEVLDLLRHMAGQCRAALRELDSVPARAGSEPLCVSAEPRERFFWHLTLEYGQRMAHMQLEWLEEVIQRIEQGEHEKGGSGEGSGG